MDFRIKDFTHHISSWASALGRLAFALTIVVTPLRARLVLLERPVPQIYKDYTDFILLLSDIFIFLVLLFWCLSLLFSLRPITFGPKFVTVPMTGLLLASIISVTSSLDVPLSLYYLFRLTILLLFYLYVINEIHSILLVILAIAFQVVSESAVAISQFFIQGSIGLEWLGEHKLDPAIPGVSVLFDGSTRLLRAYGLSEHPNILGGSLAFGLLLLLTVYLYGKRRSVYIIAFCFLAGMLAVLFTFSRSAWLAFFAGSAVILGTVIVLRKWENLKRFFLLALVSGILLAPFVVTNLRYISARFNYNNSFENNPIEAGSVDERLLLNNAAVQLFLRNPLKGTGIGSSPLAIKAYYANITDRYMSPPHFALLAVAMETGGGGAICYLTLLLLPLSIFFTRKDLRARPVLVATSAVLFAITLAGLFDIYPWLIPTGRLWQWTAWGLWAAAYESRK